MRIAVLELDDEARRLAEVERRPPPAFQSPAEWSAAVIVTRSPAASTVPPLFMPITASPPPGRRRASHRLISWMHGQTGRSRLARATASPIWSSWPWVTSSRSQRSTASAGFGLLGLANHGSTMTVLPPGRLDLDAGMAVPGDRGVGRDRHGGVPPLSSSMLPRGYTRGVSATQIAQNLAFINWTVLTGLALGSYAAVVAPPPPVRRDPRLPGVHGGLCRRVRRPRLAQRWGVARRRLGSSPVVADPAFDRAASCLAGVLRARRARARRRVALGAGAARSRSSALAAGAATLVFGALAWGDGRSGHAPARAARRALRARPAACSPR